MGEGKDDIEKILAERTKLDEELRTRFTKKITVMFTDIKGSTSFYEQRGDVDGRLMVHRHNELVLPVIARNRGVLIKTIGDATLSIYEDASDGVRAAQQVQQTLREYNAGQPAERQINVRIGLNTGLGIVEKQDVFGDVVNTASRVESLADAGEVLVTEDLYREVKAGDEFIFRYFDEAKLKGKKVPIKAYRLVWHEEELSLGKPRSGMQAPRTRESVVVLDASVSGRNIRLSVSTRKEGEERAVKNYREVPYDAEKVREYTRAIIAVLNSASRRGRIGNDLLVRLKEQGSLLFDQLLPVEIKALLKQTTESSLLVSIDDNLVHVPWELLYDGSDFLCLRFSMGRSVSTRQAVASAVRLLQRPLKMQVLADPRGDLQAAYEEGVAIKNEIGGYEDWIDVSLKTTDISADYARSKIRNFDIVHYAGHAEHNADTPGESGWLMKDGRLNAAGIMAMAGSRPMPALVFSNACQSGRTEAWKLDADYGTRIFGLANAFLLAGVQHYIGTFWEIPDEAGALFARSFYRGLAAGASIGSALRAARQSIVQAYGEDTIIWASYMLYGDPTARYPGEERREARQEQAVPAKEQGVPAATGTRGEFRQTRVRKRLIQTAVVVAVLIVGALAAVLVATKDKRSAKTETTGVVKIDQQPRTGPRRAMEARRAPSPPPRAAERKSPEDAGNMSLREAAKKAGAADVLRSLLKNGADVNEADENGSTALHIAVLANNTEGVRALLDAKANAHLKNSAGKTPLDLAANHSRIGMLHLLVQSGVKIASIPDRGAEYLRLAVREKHAGLVESLMRAGADATRPGPFGNTPLMDAAKTGWSEGVLILARHGASLNAVDGMGCTALMQAVKNGDREIARVLLEAGADPGIPDAVTAATPLMELAQKRQQEDLAMLLIKHGAKVNSRNSFGKTALHIAVEMNNVPFARLLVNAKADVNAADQVGNTPLKVAEVMNLKEMTDVLEGR